MVLDLDGDGLELIAASGTVLFDHNADGIKTGTGWAAPNDGLLVRDLNGNGAIDSGRELFGIDTLKRNNTFATQGFDALKELDSNADGFITNADTAFADLKVWQDLNQDGISQAGELKTLTQWGITSISANGSTSGPQAGQVINGNRVDLSATFTQNGATRTVGSVDFQVNNFFTQFPAQVVDEAGNPVAITAQARALPQMNGSGTVRNMQAAASLSPGFAATLQTFAATTTRDAQRSQLDALITRWADTSTFENSILVTSRDVSYIMPEGVTVEHFKHLISVLEVFNGTHFYSLAPNVPRPAGFATTSSTDPSTGVIAIGIIIAPPAEQVALLQQAYDALKESVYGALVVQTRLAPYLDSISLVIDDSGVSFDTAGLNTLLASTKTANEKNAFIDLIELNRFSHAALDGVGYDGLGVLKAWIDALPAASAIHATLAELNVYGASVTNGSASSDIWYGNATANSFSGGAGDDLLTGDAGDDYLYGGAGNDSLSGGDGVDELSGGDGADTLTGGAGDDRLYGANGYYGGGGLGDNDTLDGGAGNDYLMGGMGSDTYLFGRGDGSDTIYNIADAYSGGGDPNVGKRDVLQFKAGVLSTDVTASREGDSLVLKINGTTDQVSVQSFFTGDGVSVAGYALEEVRFADGTAWDYLTVQAMVSTSVIIGTSVDNSLSGTATSDQLFGLGGNDTLNGGAGNDLLDGGAGSDSLLGGAGNDVYVVDATTDTVTETANNGIDTVRSSVNWTLGANVENLFLTGVTAINGTGNSLANVLVGNSAANVLAGGTGNDTYFVGTGDTVTEAGNAGTDTVLSNVTWTLSSNVENLTLLEGAAIDGTGNTLNNVLVGNSSANVLNGGAGADTMSGGGGDDTYSVDNAGDLVTENPGAGIDRVNSSITYSLTANVENLILTGSTVINGTGNELANLLTGNSANNILTGGAGNDTLNGGAGSDAMLGGMGDDIYVVDVATDVVTENAGEGLDIVNSSIAWTLSDNVENLTLTGTAAINGTGNALDNVLTGNSGANVLTGGAGNDTYVVGTGDTTIEAASAGTDTVQSAIAWTLATNVENLTLIGTAAINGTGNTADNVLTGNSGINTLTGNAGNDTLNGGAGADILVGGTGNDTYWLGRGYGLDTINENDATAGNTDVARFDTGIARDQLWFTKTGNNLDVSIVGTTDKFTISNWYLGNQYHVEQFRTSDGKTLLDSQVQNLVNAMAAFSPPAAGQTTLPANYSTTLAPVIAANWQ